MIRSITVCLMYIIPALLHRDNIISPATYSLTIRIDADGRNFLLKNNETIVLVFSPRAGDCYSVVFAAFNPFGDSNVVYFGNRRIAYAASQQLIYGDPLVQNSSIGVAPGKLYPFMNLGFKGSIPAFSDKVSGIINKRKTATSENIACGFASEVKFNNVEGYGVICLYSLPYEQTLYFEPLSKVLIFTGKGFFANMILPPGMLKPNGEQSPALSKGQVLVTGSYLEIDLNETSNVVFDNVTHTFVKGN